MEKIFERCLVQCYNVDLWRAYITYVKRAKAGQPDAVDALVSAFDFALQHIGFDINSNTIYQDYIDFVRGWDVVRNLNFLG